VRQTFARRLSANTAAKGTIHAASLHFWGFDLLRFATLLWLLIYFQCDSAAATNSAPEPAKLGACVGCHGKNGVAIIKSYPNLNGQNAAYMELALKAYQSGNRKNAAMQGIVGMLSEADIRALSSYYAAQPAVKPATP
jgi:cytochrome c553